MQIQADTDGSQLKRELQYLRRQGAGFRRDSGYRGFAMLRMALAFLAIALTAVASQFFGLAMVTAGIARLVFFIFMLLFLFCLGGHIYRGS